jgi:hypothetical protein
MGVMGAVLIGSIAFTCFFIYVLIKSLEFVIQAVNLYRTMIARQEAIIKHLIDIKSLLSQSTGNDSREKKTVDNSSMKAIDKQNGDGPSDAGAETNEHQGEEAPDRNHIWSNDYKKHNIVMKCWKCGDIYHGSEYNECPTCKVKLKSPFSPFR